MLWIVLTAARRAAAGGAQRPAARAGGLRPAPGARPWCGSCSVFRSPWPSSRPSPWRPLTQPPQFSWRFAAAVAAGVCGAGGRHRRPAGRHAPVRLRRGDVHAAIVPAPGRAHGRADRRCPERAGPGWAWPRRPRAWRCCPGRRPARRRRGPRGSLRPGLGARLRRRAERLSPGGRRPRSRPSDLCGDGFGLRRPDPTIHRPSRLSGVHAARRLLRAVMASWRQSLGAGFFGAAASACWFAALAMAPPEPSAPSASSRRPSPPRQAAASSRKSSPSARWPAAPPPP
jgi:hypothetical protein